MHCYKEVNILSPNNGNQMENSCRLSNLTLAWIHEHRSNKLTPNPLVFRWCQSSHYQHMCHCLLAIPSHGLTLYSLTKEFIIQHFSFIQEHHGSWQIQKAISFHRSGTSLFRGLAKREGISMSTTWLDNYKTPPPQPLKGQKVLWFVVEHQGCWKGQKTLIF